jgi:putative ABC transport system permease protein
MRFADLLRLSLAALWQQKTRAVLTTLGVVFGAFVLVISLSLGQGVQETIDREGHRNANLRKVEVWPVWRGKEEDVPAGELQVPGAMSEERRQRLRKALVERKLRYRPQGPHVPLNRERLRELAALEHVETVTPLVQRYGAWAILGEHSQQVATCSAVPDNPRFGQRVIAGHFFRTADDRSAVISELLAYQLGATADEDVAALVDRTLRIEYRTEQRSTGLAVYLAKGDGESPSRAEALVLEKIRRQLPLALDHLHLTPAEQDTLRKALSGTPPRTAQVQAEELTIAGVLRPPTEEERNLPWERFDSDAEVLLPLKTAEDLFFRQPNQAEYGVDHATVQVDRDENVREVARRITAMGLQAHAPIEYIDRERFIYLMIFTTMTCVAAVALLVAALGIANTMLMSVLERTREIGILKAVGAADAHVLLIFLVEGACIGLVGGGLGLLLAWVGSFPADTWIRSIVSRDLKVDLKESLFVFPPWLTVGVILFAALVTTLAAVYPARRAARVMPLTALRHE